MEEMTIDQRQALALASARLRLQQQAPTSAPVEDTRTPAGRASVGDIVAGLPATRIIAGLASPFVGALQIGANIGDYINEQMGKDPMLSKYLAEKIGEYESSKKRGMAALGDTVGTDIAGTVGAGVSGGLLMRGMVPATGYAGRVAQGIGVGAGAGATTPSSTPGIEQSMIQAGTGAVIGGAIPAAAPVVSTAARGAYRTFVEPLTNPAAIKGRAYMEAAGDKAPQIINALRASQPVVPGSFPTAGEAAASAGRAEFSALQRSAENVLPSNYLARTDARNAARANQLGQVAGTEAEMVAAQRLRETTAKQNYGLAKIEGIDQDMAAAMQPQIDSLMGRPSMIEAKALAVKLAREKDIALTDFGSIEGLDWVKKGLDEQISAAAKVGSAAGKEKLGALMQTKADLLATIKEIAPAYDVARATFATQSKPINQMEVGQYLKGKLTSAVDETAGQRAASFAGAVRDAPGTLKRSLTGAPRYEKLSDVLTPDQIAKVESVRQDFANIARQELMAQKGAQVGPNAMEIATRSISSATGGNKIPNPLSRVVTMANAVIGRLEGKIDRKLAIEIAAEMLDPKVVAAALERETAKVARKAATAATTNKLRLPGMATGVNALTDVTFE